MLWVLLLSAVPHLYLNQHHALSYLRRWRLVEGQFSTHEYARARFSLRDGASGALLPLNQSHLFLVRHGEDCTVVTACLWRAPHAPREWHVQQLREWHDATFPDATLWVDGTL